MDYIWLRKVEKTRPFGKMKGCINAIMIEKVVLHGSRSSKRGALFLVHFLFDELFDIVFRPAASFQLVACDKARMIWYPHIPVVRAFK